MTYKMDVPGLVCSLCSSFLEEALFERYEDDLLKSLIRPSRWRRWSDGHHSSVLKRLKHRVFERLLLEKWKWFRYDDGEMLVKSRCLAFAYGQSSRDGNQLQAMITKLEKCQLTEKEAILHFMLLMCSNKDDLEGQRLLNDSGVCMCDSLFESVPRLCDVDNLHSALTSSQRLFECTPGSGFRGWSSQLPLDKDKAPPPSSLFRGLTHTKTADINTVLNFPQLLPNKPVTMTTHPLPYLQPSDFSNIAMASSYGMPELDGMICCTEMDDGGLLRQWEGWQSRSCYLSEAPCFADSAHLAFDRLTRLHCDDVMGPSPPTPGRLVHQLIWEMDHLPLQLINQPPAEGGSVVTALVDLLQVLLTYCRSQLSTLTDVCSSELLLCAQAHHLLPLCQFVIELVSCVHDFPKGLDLVSRIYDRAVAAQSGDLYPLLLSILSYIMEPYLRFVEQWVFLGQLDWGEEFGIHRDQHALNRRDEEYWRSGYVMATSCSPSFLRCHDNTLLTAGKALNLLKLCSPKHPLCSGEVSAVRLRLHLSADTLEAVHEECEDYSNIIRELMDTRERERKDKLEAVRAKARRELQQRREEAIKDAKRIRMAEEASIAALKDKKQTLLRELQHQMKLARAVKVEAAANEKKQDAAMMETLTQQEDNLAAQVRSEMLAHYGDLTRGVELRQARAEWRVKRMNLQEKRIEFLASEERRWRDDTEQHNEFEGMSELQPYVDNHQTISPSSHDYNTTSRDQENLSHDHDTTSPDLSSSTELEGEKDFAASKSDREPTPPLEHVNVQTQQMPGTMHSGEHQLTSAEASSAKELIYPDAVVNEEGHPRSVTMRGTDQAVNEQGYPRMFSTRGQAPRSTIEAILYGSEEPLPQEVVSTRGHAPPTTIQHLLYPLRHATPTNLNDSGSHDNQQSTDDDLEEFGPSSKFIDHYHLLDEAPGRDMLCNMLGPVTSDPTPIDSVFLSLYPLEALLETSLALPIITQSNLVNKALLDHFLGACSIQTHFTAIKRFLLLEDGEFAHVLCSGLCEELAYGATPLYLCSSSFLNPLLRRALESSLHGHTPQALRLAFNLKHRPTIIHTQAIDALEFLELKYEVEWPVNIVITPSTLDKYNKVFQLLLQMKRASWALKAAFHHLRQQQGLGEHKSRQLQTYRHQFQHFVNIMLGYMANQLFYISWREFEVELSTKVHSLDDLIQAHTRFIDNTIFRCLLSKKAKPVMNIVQEVLSCVLWFSTQSALVSSTNSTYRSMCDTHRKFSNAARLLIKVVSKLVARGYQPHLEDLLLRLNFNNFYGQ